MEGRAYTIYPQLFSEDQVNWILDHARESREITWWDKRNQEYFSWTKARLRKPYWLGVQASLAVAGIGFGIENCWDISGGFEDAILAKYVEGDYAHWHKDHTDLKDALPGKEQRVCSRIVTSLCLLKQADKGGVLELEGVGPIDWSPGDVITFAATRKHRVTPVESGDRYSVHTIVRATDIYEEVG